jgi:hypothetical protein
MDRTVETMSGAYDRIVYHTKDVIQCEIAEGEYYDELGSQLGDNAMKMFFTSVQAGELFYMSDLDDSDTLKDYQLVGRWSRSRISPVDVSKFRYSFSIREVVQ